MINRSAVLPLDFVLCGKSDNDTEPKLRECVNLRLGPSILDKIKLNTNTQKVESANQTMRRDMPIHTTFSAMFESLCHSAIYVANYGSAESLTQVCDGMGCSISPGSSVAKAIQTEQHNYQWRKSYNNSERMY